MQKLVYGYERFRRDVFPGKRMLFEELAGEQNPEALFISCSDSRVQPDLLTQSEPGELFHSRNPGNIVPPYGDRIGGVSATIEYALLVLDVKHIVVCGHSDCGAMRAVLHPERIKRMPTVEAWLQYAELGRSVMDESYPEMSEDRKLHILIRENVLAQLDHLKTHPSVAARLKRGELNLHGWIYEIHTGLLEAYDVERHEFVPLESDSIPSATPRSRRLAVAEVVR